MPECMAWVGPDHHGPQRRCGENATHMQDPERPTWMPGSTRYYCQRHADEYSSLFDVIEIQTEWPCPCCGKTLDHPWGCAECRRIIQFGSPLKAAENSSNYVGVGRAAERCDRAHEEGIDSLPEVYRRA